MKKYCQRRFFGCLCGNPAFFLFLYLIGVHFRGQLQHGGDVSQQEIKCRPIRTREVGDVSLSDVLYANDKVVADEVNSYFKNATKYLGIDENT